jgi:hypothetical protein
MIYPFRKLQENWDSIKKMKPKARQVRMNQLTKSMDDPGSKKYQEHEAEVNNVAIGLGFQKEIDALEVGN